MKIGNAVLVDGFVCWITLAFIKMIPQPTL